MVLPAGPEGEVIVYYKDGDNIVVRNCGKGYPEVNQRPDCNGPENRLPVDVFKRALRQEILLDEGKIGVLSAEERKAYKLASDNERLTLLRAREKELEAKLSRIRAFIKKFGDVDSGAANDQVAVENLLAEVRQQLTSPSGEANAVKKVNNFINKLVDEEIADSSKMKPVSVTEADDMPAFMLMRQFDASKGECGTDAILDGREPLNPGNDDNNENSTVRKATWLKSFLIPEALADGHTVEERIKNCIVLPGAVKKTKAGVLWNLVSRSRDPKTGRFYEVWKDCGKPEDHQRQCNPNGLLWGDRLDNPYKFYDAVALDFSGNPLSESACKSDNAQRANNAITDRKFGLPTIEEYRAAEVAGIREILPNMDSAFWSATSAGVGRAQPFYGHDGASRDTQPVENAYSIRCVGR